MRLSITKAVKEVLQVRFKELLREPELESVAYVETYLGKSYNLMEYSLMWSKFAKVADLKIQEVLKDELGVFTRKRSRDFLVDLRDLCNGITATDVSSSVNRFKTWMD
jgi:hypothetical protein